MKRFSLLFLSIIILSSCNASKKVALDHAPSEPSLSANIMSSTKNSELDGDYEKMNQTLADIKRQLDQPNILKDDIVRGWYSGSKLDRKFGTPDTWVFVEDGLNSKWMSPNAMDEGDLIDNQELCRQTAGAYVLSCLESSDKECEYVGESHCECASGSFWKEEQGCILTTERGSFVSINSAELTQGWYLGLPNEKKLNTPGDWKWVEKGKESVWHSSSSF